MNDDIRLVVKIGHASANRKRLQSARKMYIINNKKGIITYNSNILTQVFCLMQPMFYFVDPSSLNFHRCSDLCNVHVEVFLPSW